MGVKKYCLINAKVIYFKKAAARESLKMGENPYMGKPLGA